MRVETDVGEVLITVIIRRVKELEKVFVITAASLRVQPSLLAPWCEGSFTGKMSAPQWQKCHIDDIKSVQNLVRSSHWSKYYFDSFCDCLRIADKTQKVTKVKCKGDKSFAKQSIFLEYIYVLLQRKCLSFAAARLQKNTKLNCNPMTTRLQLCGVTHHLRCQKRLTGFWVFLRHLSNHYCSIHCVCQIMAAILTRRSSKSKCRRKCTGLFSPSHICVCDM